MEVNHMKKIAVVAANGRVANKVITEAVNRGFEVTGFGRKDNNTEAQKYIKKDIFDHCYAEFGITVTEAASTSARPTEKPQRACGGATRIKATHTITPV